MSIKKSRRSFIKKATAGMLASGSILQIISAKERMTRQLEARKSYSANDTIRLGAIGMGIMGNINCTTALKIPGIELVAVCDLYQGRLNSSKERFGNHLFCTTDYMEILERSDIDAVVISTSDHWHDHISIAAMEAGKAVYCEKPMVHHIEEGKAVIQTEKKKNGILQIGSQGVSSIRMAKASELYKEGVIGQLILVETFNDRHSALGAWQYSIPVDGSPKTVDWNTFQGDAPKKEFDLKRFFRWRNYNDYGTGIAGDLFVHLFSGMHVVLDSYGPNRIYATGGIRYWKDGRDAPDVMIAALDYPESKSHPAFNLQIRVNFVAGSGSSQMLRFVGSEGVMTIEGGRIKIQRNKMAVNPGYGGWDSYGTFTKEGQKEYRAWYKENFPEQASMTEPKELVFETPPGYSDDVEHWQNFADAIRGEYKIVEDASFGLRAAAPALACNKSLFEKRIIDWDPIGMKLI